MVILEDVPKLAHLPYTLAVLTAIAVTITWTSLVYANYVQIEYLRVLPLTTGSIKASYINRRNRTELRGGGQVRGIDDDDDYVTKWSRKISVPRLHVSPLLDQFTIIASCCVVG